MLPPFSFLSMDQPLCRHLAAKIAYHCSHLLLLPFHGSGYQCRNDKALGRTMRTPFRSADGTCRLSQETWAASNNPMHA